VRLHPELREGQYVRLTVADTGMGIEPGVVERVFEPFFTTKPPGQGSGLGLSMVHGIMSDHEGAVILSSEVGKGTQIQCYFPALETDAVAPMTPERETPSGHGERVLLVDDERSLASVGERRLTALGYAVTVSTDPVTALEMFRERPGDFDLVMTDYSMPRMNGLDLARAIHQIRPELPILLSTGFAEEFAQESLEPSGIRQVLNKPLGIQDLAVALRAILNP
jgi:CheY-like chemotaxis protein